MKAKVAVVAAIAMVVGLTVGFIVGRHGSSGFERQANTSAISTSGCEGEFRMLVYSVFSDMRGGWLGKSPFVGKAKDEMVAKGYADPAKEIIEDLRVRPDLIPFSGVLGGTMAFREFRVLSSNRVLAMFDDGHIGGWALLGFEAKERGKIEWKLVYATIEDQEVVKSRNW